MSRAGMHTPKLFSAKLLYPFVSLLVSTLGVSADITKNLVAHYTLDEKSGGVANDSSGRKNHGSLEGYDSGITGWTTGRIEGALSFDGTDDFISVPHDSDFDLKTYTLSIWISVSLGNQVRPVLVKGKFDDGVASTDVPFGLYLNAENKLTLAYEKASSSQRLAENMSYEANGEGLAPGTVYHVAVTRKNSGGIVKFYVDGQPRGGFENTPKPGDNNKKLYIGADPKTNQLFKGGLDDVRIYARSLELSDIQELYELGAIAQQTNPADGEDTSGGDETPPENQTGRNSGNEKGDEGKSESEKEGKGSENNTETESASGTDNPSGEGVQSNEDKSLANGNETNLVETEQGSQLDESASTFTTSGFESENSLNEGDSNVVVQETTTSNDNQNGANGQRQDASGSSETTGDYQEQGDTYTDVDDSKATGNDSGKNEDGATGRNSNDRENDGKKGKDDPKDERSSSETTGDYQEQEDIYTDVDDPKATGNDSGKNEDGATGRNSNDRENDGKKGKDHSKDERSSSETTGDNQEQADTYTDGDDSKATGNDSGKNEDGATGRNSNEGEDERKDNESEDSKNEGTANQAPTNVTLSKKSIYEGGEPGSVVGQFRVVDPDDPDGKGTYLIEIVSNNSYSRRAKRLEIMDETSNKDQSKDSEKSVDEKDQNQSSHSTWTESEKTTDEADSKSSERKGEKGKSDSDEKAEENDGGDTSLAKKSSRESNSEDYTKTDSNDEKTEGNLDTSLFAISRSGKLVSIQTLDYETRNSYSVRVRATDEGGLWIEKDFVIQVKNAHVPIVQTMAASEITSRKAVSHGEILATGNSPISELGIVISKQPLFKSSGTESATIRANKIKQRFVISLNKLEPETTYFFRAYATNSEGTSYGVMERFVTRKADNGIWANTRSIGAGWVRSDWLGNVYPTENDWIYHEGLGWLYAKKNDGEGIWLYSQDFLGWFWTSSKTYPFVYADNSRSWAYYKGVLAEHRVFYHFGQNSWMAISRKDSSKRKKKSGKESSNEKTSKQNATKETSALKNNETRGKEVGNKAPQKR